MFCLGERKKQDRKVFYGLIFGGPYLRLLRPRKHVYFVVKVFLSVLPIIYKETYLWTYTLFQR